MAGADEHQLAGEEVVEVDEFFVFGDVDVGFLLKREPNRQSKRGLSAGAAMTGGHDAAARASDDHPSVLHHSTGEIGGLQVIGVGFRGASAAEDADFAGIAV